MENWICQKPHTKICNAITVWHCWTQQAMACTWPGPLCLGCLKYQWSQMYYRHMAPHQAMKTFTAPSSKLAGVASYKPFLLSRKKYHLPQWPATFLLTNTQLTHQSLTMIYSLALKDSNCANSSISWDISYWRAQATLAISQLRTEITC